LHLSFTTQTSGGKSRKGIGNDKIPITKKYLKCIKNIYNIGDQKAQGGILKINDWVRKYFFSAKVILFPLVCTIHKNSGARAKLQGNHPIRWFQTKYIIRHQNSIFGISFSKYIITISS